MLDISQPLKNKYVSNLWTDKRQEDHEEDRLG